MNDEQQFRARLNFMVSRHIGGGLLSTLKLKEPFLLGADYAISSNRLFADIEAQRTAICSELNKLTPEELKAGFSEHGKPLTEFWTAWASKKRAMIKTEFGEVQGWLGLQFFPEKFPAKFDHWAKAAFFTMDEAVWLSLGLEPVTELDRLLKPAGRTSVADSAASKFVKDHFMLFARELNPHHHKGSFQASTILTWINRVELEVHPGYRRMLELMVNRASKDDMTPIPAQGQTPAKDEKVEGREKTSLAKLLLAMAITEYGYDPTARRSPIPREIQDIAARLGLEVSQDTIRHYLQLGARHLPPDWKLEE